VYTKVDGEMHNSSFVPSIEELQFNITALSPDGFIQLMIPKVYVRHSGSIIVEYTGISKVKGND